MPEERHYDRISHAKLEREPVVGRVLEDRARCADCAGVLLTGALVLELDPPLVRCSHCVHDRGGRLVYPPRGQRR